MNNRPEPGQDGEHVTFCRICEALCGMVVDVKDGQIKKIAPDRNNPHSLGHICVKGVAIADVVRDPDRIRSPMRRNLSTNEFEAVSWAEALSDIARRFAAVQEHHGSDAIASYMGNPSAFSLRALFGGGPLFRALGIRKFFNTGTQDTTPRYVASSILYGDVQCTPIPDLHRCDFLMIFGANPLISHGSMLTAPRLREDLDAIAKRGRIVVVDPRKTETAARFEHVAIKPGGDAWLLAAMIREIFHRPEHDRSFEEKSVGVEFLEQAVEPITPEVAEQNCGVPAQKIVELTDAFLSSNSAAYSRVGLCRNQHATLANCLLDALNIVANRFAVPGGAVIGYNPVSAGKPKSSGYAPGRSRVSGLPWVAGAAPTVLLAPEILEEGEGRVRALLMTAGNPVLSAPGGDLLVKALKSLEIFVSLDLYINESNRYAHYVLPTTTFLERADVPSIPLDFLIEPFLQYSAAVVKPQGEAKEEGDIFLELARLIGGNEVKQTDPFERFDRMLRSGAVGDGFGERPDGLSLTKLKDHPHGVLLETVSFTETWRHRIAHEDGKIRLWDPMISDEFARLQASRPVSTTDRTMLVIGRRDLKSINSWMHNVDRFSRVMEPKAIICGDDAARLGVSSGDRIVITNEFGAIEVEVDVSAEMMPGVISYPHGWGHGGGWRQANAIGGQNVNILAPNVPERVEQVSGASLLDGIAVEVRKVPVDRSAPISAG